MGCQSVCPKPSGHYQVFPGHQEVLPALQNPCKEKTTDSQKKKKSIFFLHQKDSVRGLPDRKREETFTFCFFWGPVARGVTDAGGGGLVHVLPEGAILSTAVTQPVLLPAGTAHTLTWLRRNRQLPRHMCPGATKPGGGEAELRSQSLWVYHPACNQLLQRQGNTSTHGTGWI